MIVAKPIDDDDDGGDGRLILCPRVNGIHMAHVTMMVVVGAGDNHVQDWPGVLANDDDGVVDDDDDGVDGLGDGDSTQVWSAGHELVLRMAIQIEFSIEPNRNGRAKNLQPLQMLHVH